MAGHLNEMREEHLGRFTDQNTKEEVSMTSAGADALEESAMEGSLSDAEQNVRSFAREIFSTKCTNCEKPLATTREEVGQLALQLQGNATRQSIDCPSCGNERTASAEARLLTVLCGFDECVLQLAAQNARDVASSAASASKKWKQDSTRGIGYELDDSSMEELDEFDGDSGRFVSASEDSGNTPRVDTTSADNKLREALQAVFEAASAVAPCSLVTDMILCSRIFDVAAELLDSADFGDVERRANLYQVLIKVLFNMLDQERGLVALTSTTPRDDVGSSGFSLHALCLGSEHGSSRPVLSRGSRSIATQLEGIAKGYDEIFHKISGASDAINREHKDVITQIVKLSGKLEASTNTDIDEETSWQKDLKCCPVDDDSMWVHNSFGEEMDTAHTTTRARTKAICRDILTLRADLPGGIFVKYGEARPELMKALIVGPQDSPYENGIFEFDLYLPSNYPSQPPMVTFRTTGGGNVSFNPNLYPEGDVCLSLLGTYDFGVPWQPERSTLLQLLVSIQAMIFCAEPYFNEPGEEGERGSDESMLYNRDLHPNVIKYGMLDWVEGMMRLDSGTGKAKTRQSSCDFWQDVLRKYFEAYGLDMIKTARKWTEEDPGGQSNAALPELQDLKGELEAAWSILVD